ncbi:ElyC/SanA/YdcF family protein [Desertihabitans brevis]|uniref:ElyC/SanA/YdcF family protein n=1 Tax=Desertihabitans brevis TaxID=2268447 RepID=UPI001313FB20|nr:ElyC/SanA/YdcF family protein [Desertihabitans brevis]
MLLVLVLLLGVVGVVFAGLVGLPRIDRPSPVDAVLVLGPSDDRLEDAEELMAEQDGAALVVSLPEPFDESPATVDFCEADHDHPVHCIHPEPSTTQGEAQAFAALAAEEGWESVGVLTHRSHLTRAGILVGRCFDGEIQQWRTTEDYGTRMWIYRLVYEAGAWVKMGLTPGCEDELGWWPDYVPGP